MATTKEQAVQAGGNDNSDAQKPFAEAYESYVSELNKAWIDVGEQVRRIEGEYARDAAAATCDPEANRKLNEAYVAAQKKMLGVVEADEFQRRAKEAFVKYRVSVVRALAATEPVKLDPTLLAQVGQSLIAAAALAQSTTPT